MIAGAFQTVEVHNVRCLVWIQISSRLDVIGDTGTDGNVPSSIY